jgi:hypothetical protein
MEVTSTSDVDAIENPTDNGENNDWASDICADT